MVDTAGTSRAAWSTWQSWRNVSPYCANGSTRRPGKGLRKRFRKSPGLETAQASLGDRAGKYGRL